MAFDPDLEFLDIRIALEQIGDAQTLHGMLSMLEESLSNDIPRIEALLVAGDVRGANRLLHSMKGVIPIFCATPFCQHVAQVEELSKVAEAADVRMAYAMLQPELEQLHAEVAGYLNGPGAAG